MARSVSHSPALLLASALLLLTLLSQGLAQDPICSPLPEITVPEDRAVGGVIYTVPAEDGVTISLPDNVGGKVKLNGQNITLGKPLDFETETGFLVTIQCQKGTETTNHNIFIAVENVNDNNPEFTQRIYQFTVPELLTVDTSVGKVSATDADGGQLYYEILPDPPQDYFELQGFNPPNIVVKNRFEFDTVQNVQFIVEVRDTINMTPETRTATSTVSITVQDIDNRPPWFVPCTVETINTFTKICLSEGYTGLFNRSQQATGPLPLNPNNLSAKDGDKNINAEISYSILSGNEAGIFAISSSTGEITMTKATNASLPFSLTIMAFQTLNPDQFSTTTVTIEGKVASSNPPKFEKDSYEGYISLDAGVNSLVLEGQGSTKPLQVQATDVDDPEGNPYLQYEVQGTEDFIATDYGFIVMRKKVPAGPVSFQVRAHDTKSGQEALTAVQVNVSAETPTTTPRPTTTAVTASTPKDTPTTPKDTPTTTKDTPTTTTVMPTTPKDTPTTPKATPTASKDTPPPPSDKPSVSTALPSNTADATRSSSPQTSADTQRPTAKPPGEEKRGVYGVEHMAALGATLGILLLIALILIALMAVHIRKHEAHGRKVKEASYFHSILAGASLKGAVQYSNEGFQNDGDTASTNSSWSDKPGDREVEAPVSRAVVPPVYETVVPDTSSLAESTKSEAEKEVKPILTKERKDDEGYKAVWFKQDIDPEAKDEVTIIPDRTEQADDDDDEEDEDEEDMEEEDNEDEDEDEDEDRSVGREASQADSDHNGENSDSDDYQQTSDL